jgi:hypothetical protein
MRQGREHQASQSGEGGADHGQHRWPMLPAKDRQRKCVTSFLVYGGVREEQHILLCVQT